MDFIVLVLSVNRVPDQIQCHGHVDVTLFCHGFLDTIMNSLSRKRARSRDSSSQDCNHRSQSLSPKLETPVHIDLPVSILTLASPKIKPVRGDKGSQIVDY